MIFVILGTEKFQFDRLVQEIDSLIENKTITDEVFVQIGSCKYVPKYYRYKKFMSFEQMRSNIEKSSIIIAHAGAGTTLLCVQMGHRPIIVPRQKIYSEHIDDHQVSFSKKFETTGLVDVVYNIKDLKTHYENHPQKKSVFNESSSKRHLVNYLIQTCKSWSNNKLDCDEL